LIAFSIHRLTILNLELLSVWHEFRIPILVSIVISVAAIQLFVYIRKSRTKLSSPSSPGSPVLLDSKAVDRIEFTSTPDIAIIPDDGHVEDIKVISSQLVQKPAGPRKVVGSKVAKRTVSFDTAQDRIQPLVFFSSLTGTTEKAASKLLEDIGLWTDASSSDEVSRLKKPLLHDLSYIDYDDYFVSPPRNDNNVKYFYLVLIPTYNIDTTLNNFLENLQETHHDFRIDTAPLSGLLGYSVFGFGDQEGWPTEEEGFCSQAKEVDKWLAKLTGRKRAFPLGMGDVKSDAKQRLEEWRLGVQEVLMDLASGAGLGEGVPGSGAPVESDEEDIEDEDEEMGDKNKPRKMSRKADLNDLEDLGGAARKTKKKQPNSTALAVDFTNYARSKSGPAIATLKEMVPKTSPTYAALTKQGYTIVGSHSGVKICRWTKSALRGRGSCYKYSFYGIKSHLCMETTPSLSCSNKCVFCWRHGTNPVGTTWRWQVDPPEEIFKGVTEGHYKKLKMMKGVPGVRAERFAEAMRIRHCALSLVGEPIFYPHINEFTAMLHKEHISSFLVCNAQHPDQLAALRPVTQLYVSIDASNKDSLRKIDRPLHRDFWERFIRCLDILREKRFRQRTVFRLTLVKGFNIDDEVEGYADLVARGLPCFVEIKGVTYCGTSTSSSAGLTMQNVPFYEEVSAFVIALNEALAKRGLKYGIAAEHAHSCCVLIASERFKKDGKWCTLIDYERFFECLESGKEFSPEDYMGEPTPEWALWGNGGFDPRDERVDRKGKPRKD